MKKLFVVLVIVLGLVLIFTGCNSEKAGTGNGEGVGEGEGEKIVWKLGHISNTDHHWHKTSEKFAELVAEKTDGQITIEVYPNSELGSEMDVLNGILSGTMDMTISGETLANWAPVADLVAAPYAYNSEEHIMKVIDSEVGETIKSKLTEAGFKPLFYSLRTPRNLTSNKPINTPEDAKNLKMRLSNTPLAIACWEAVGANVNVMALDEVFTALNQGVIEAQENPYDLIYSSSFYEVQKYANETEHVFSYINFVVGTKQFNDLPEELQAAVLEASDEVQEFTNKVYFDTKEDYKKLVIENGMEINTDVDKEAFREIMTPAIKEYFDEEVFALYEKAIELGK